MWVRSLGWEDPWRRERQPTPVFLPGESHGRRSLVGYRPQGCKESDTTELLHFTSTSSNLSVIIFRALCYSPYFSLLHFPSLIFSYLYYLSTFLFYLFYSLSFSMFIFIGLVDRKVFLKLVLRISLLSPCSHFYFYTFDYAYFG